MAEETIAMPQKMTQKARLFVILNGFSLAATA